MFKGEGTAMYKGTEARGIVYLGNRKYILVLLENGLSFNGNGKQRC